MEQQESIAMVEAPPPVKGMRYFDYPGERRNHLLGAVRAPTALYVWMVRLRGPAPRRHRKLREVPERVATFLRSALALPGREQGQWPRHPELTTREAFRRVEYERTPRGRMPRRKR